MSAHRWNGSRLILTFGISIYAITLLGLPLNPVKLFKKILFLRRNHIKKKKGFIKPQKSIDFSLARDLYSYRKENKKQLL